MFLIDVVSPVILMLTNFPLNAFLNCYWSETWRSSSVSSLIQNRFFTSFQFWSRCQRKDLLFSPYSCYYSTKVTVIVWSQTNSIALLTDVTFLLLLSSQRNTSLRRQSSDAKFVVHPHPIATQPWCFHFTVNHFWQKSLLKIKLL